MKQGLLKKSEIILVLAGLFFILSSIYIGSGGNFAIHFLAKGLYLLGVIWFVIKN